MSTDLPDHADENKQHWNDRAHDWVAAGEKQWSRDEPVWGIWEVPEADVEMLPNDMTGMRAIELGCGTGYVSAWMARRGASVVGVDLSQEQLATADRLAVDHGVEIEFHHGSAESLPFPDNSFDFAISEYGASIWCDPTVWLAEAHRLLAPGGTLAFLANHPVASACSPLDGSDVVAELQRSYFDLHRLDWREVEVDPGGITFSLPVSGWMAVFRELGFEVQDIREPRPADTSLGRQFFVDAEWARQWPSEIVWKLRRP